MNNVYLINHPVAQHKLSILRDKTTSDLEFRKVLGEISTILAYESTSTMETSEVEIETPIIKTVVPKIKDDIVLCSILRAGNGMLDSYMDMLPFARAGHIGIYRDKFINNTVEYYFKIPENSEGKTVILLDPLIATGDTVLACIDRLKQYGVGKIIMSCVIVSLEGIKKIHHFHPDVEFYCLSIEKEITNDGYLVPGIGDAGDRLYKTK